MKFSMLFLFVLPFNCLRGHPIFFPKAENITWQYYQGTIPPRAYSQDIVAETITQLKARPKHIDNGRLIEPLFVWSEFWLDRSWVRKDAFVPKKGYTPDDSNFVLRHERTHYLLCMLFAKKLKRQLLNTDFSSVFDLSEEVRNLNLRFYQQWRVEDTAYDKETAHNENAALQAKWETKIFMELESLRYIKLMAPPEIIQLWHWAMWD